jgi:hypothetical protein
MPLTEYDTAALTASPPPQDRETSIPDLRPIKLASSKGDENGDKETEAEDDATHSDCEDGSCDETSHQRNISQTPVPSASQIVEIHPPDKSEAKNSRKTTTRVTTTKHTGPGKLAQRLKGRVRKQGQRYGEDSCSLDEQGSL